MSPLAQKILALLADGYRVEPEQFNCRFVKEAEVMPHGRGGEVQRAVMELAHAGFLDTACNGSGTAWINDKGRAAMAECPQVRNEDDARDAARYRWIKSNMGPFELFPRDPKPEVRARFPQRDRRDGSLMWHVPDAAQLDDAIDAVLVAGTKP